MTKYKSFHIYIERGRDWGACNGKIGTYRKPRSKLVRLRTLLFVKKNETQTYSFKGTVELAQCVYILTLLPAKGTYFTQKRKSMKALKIEKKKFNNKVVFMYVCLLSRKLIHGSKRNIFF